MPSPRLDNISPVELEAVDITPYKAGNTGIDYVTTFDSGKPGPHVAVTAVVHGNELCGAIAVDWLFRQEVRPVAGKLSLAFANVEAYLAFDPDDPTTSRFLDEDFNRVWSPKKLDGDGRTLELERARAIRPFIDKVDLLFDIHSMQKQSAPLILSGPLERGRQLAQAVGVPELVVSDAGHAEGVRMRDYGGFADPASSKNALLIECGQHWEKPAGDLAIASAVRFLRATGAVAPDFGEGHTGPDAKQVFAEVSGPVTIHSEAGFTFAKEWTSGEVVEKAGTLIGHDGDEPVTTPYDNCMLVMPTMKPWKGQTAVRLARVIPAPA